MVQIVDLTPEYETLYFLCLEDWSDEMREAGDHKEKWYRRMKEKGLGVKLALDDNGVAGGMIHYIPIEHSFAEGDDLYIILCIWVHGHQGGRGSFQGKGMGKALIAAAETDVRSRGAGGLAAWGVSMPFWMRASWFKKQGYTPVDKDKGVVMLWKQFKEDAKPPQWIKRKKLPPKGEDKVLISAFVDGWCSVQNLAYERTKRAAKELGDKVEVQTYDTLDKDVLLEWGISSGIYIDGRELRTGPPPPYEKIKKKIEKRVKKLKG